MVNLNKRLNYEINDFSDISSSQPLTHEFCNLCSLMSLRAWLFMYPVRMATESLPSSCGKWD